MATTPSPILIGVERVVVSCEFDASISQDERRTLCDQLVKKAQAVTSLPVAVAKAEDLKSQNLARLARQLLLRVSVSATPGDQTRKNLSLTVAPVRMARPVGPFDELKNSASLVKVQDDWVVQGPIDAFKRLLAGAPPKLRKPIRSDS